MPQVPRHGISAILQRPREVIIVSWYQHSTRDGGFCNVPLYAYTRARGEVGALAGAFAHADEGYRASVPAAQRPTT